MKHLKQITFICIIAVFVINCAPKRSETQTVDETSAAQTAEQTQTSAGVVGYDYSKILNGDLSDFAGTWVNNRGEKRNLNPDGTSGTREIPFYFEFNEDGSYNWEINFEVEYGSVEPRGGYAVSLLPVGIDIQGFVETENGISYDILPTDKTKDRIVIIQGDSPSLRAVYYREGENPVILISGKPMSDDLVLGKWRFTGGSRVDFLDNAPLIEFLPSGTVIVYEQRADHLVEKTNARWNFTAEGQLIVHENKLFTIEASYDSLTLTDRYQNRAVYHKESPESNNKKNYFIHSYGIDSDNAMEILKLDKNPYTAIESIGWSKNGLFAYRTKHMIDTGMWGGWIYSLVLLNTIDDKVIERKLFIAADTIDDDNLQEAANHFNAALLPKETLLATKFPAHSDLIREHISEWNKILKNNNIVEVAINPIADRFNNNLLKFPIADNDCWFEIKQIIENEKDVVEWKLIIGNELSKKVISEGEYEKLRDMPNISGRKILGYYKSPFENRIVVVVSHYDYISFSGGYHNVNLDLYGCNMYIGLR